MVKVEIFELPEDLYYTEEHEWARVEEGKKVRVGLTDFAQKLAGEIIYVDLPDEGTKVERMQVVATYESGKWVGKLHAPVSGVIVEVNRELEERPELINEDPYGKGWVIVIEAENLDEEIKKLLHGDKAVEWLKEEIERRRDLVERIKAEYEEG